MLPKKMGSVPFRRQNRLAGLGTVCYYEYNRIVYFISLGVGIMAIRRLEAIVVILLIVSILGFSFLHQGGYLPSRERTLLKQIGLETAGGYRTIYHSYWNDFLQYTDGYECLVIRFNEQENESVNTAVAASDQWNASELQLQDLEKQLLRPVNKKVSEELLRLEIGDLSGRWILVEREHEQMDRSVALYDYGKRTLLIYREHHRYGL